MVYAKDGVCCVDGGTVGLALLDRLSNLGGLIALDAMKLGKRPGAVTVLQGTDMDEHLRNQKGSVHEVGLSDLMDALRLEGDAEALARSLGACSSHISLSHDGDYVVACVVLEGG